MGQHKAPRFPNTKRALRDRYTALKTEYERLVRLHADLERQNTEQFQELLRLKETYEPEIVPAAGQTTWGAAREAQDFLADLTSEDTVVVPLPDATVIAVDPDRHAEILSSFTVPDYRRDWGQS